MSKFLEIMGILQMILSFGYISNGNYIGFVGIILGIFFYCMPGTSDIKRKHSSFTGSGKVKE